MAKGRNWKSKVLAYLKSPKTQATLLVLGGYAAGVYGGPAGKVAFDKYAPTALQYLTYLFGV